MLVAMLMMMVLWLLLLASVLLSVFKLLLAFVLLVFVLELLLLLVVVVVVVMLVLLGSPLGLLGLHGLGKGLNRYARPPEAGKCRDLSTRISAALQTAPQHRGGRGGGCSR